MDKIMTLHPEGKEGVNIDRDKYETIKQAILDTLEKGDHTFNELTATLETELQDSFEGSIPWYTTTVKLDLEARNLIQRVAGSSPQRLQLVKS